MKGKDGWYEYSVRVPSREQGAPHFTSGKSACPLSLPPPLVYLAVYLAVYLTAYPPCLTILPVCSVPPAGH